MNKLALIVAALATSLAVAGTALAASEAPATGNSSQPTKATAATPATAEQNGVKKAESNTKPDAKGGNAATTAKIDHQTPHPPTAEAKTADPKK